MIVRTARAIGATTRQRREDLGLTQQEVADTMGVSRKWVNQFESGKGTAQLRLVFDILTVLGMELDAREADSGIH